MLKLRAKLKGLTAAGTITMDTNGNPAEIEAYKDKDLDVDVKVHRDHRSLDANACLWACLGELAGALEQSNWDMYLMELKAYGQFTQVRVWEDALPELKRHWREIEVVGSIQVMAPMYDEEGQALLDAAGYPMEEERTECFVNCYYGSHTYNTKEFSRLLSGVIEDMKAAGLTPPPSQEMRRMLREMEEKEKKDNANK